MNPSSFDKRFYGLYKGTVVDNNDPLNKNRLKIRVPQVTGSGVTAWAEECRSANLAGQDVPNGGHARIVNSETSSTPVVIAGGASATKVTFDTDDGANGVYINKTSPSRIQVIKPGTYFFGVTVQLYYNGAGADERALFWFSKTGSAIPGSAKRQTVKGSNHWYNFFFATTQDMTADDYIEVSCVGSDSSFQINYLASSGIAPSQYKAVLNAFCTSGALPAIGSGVWVMYEGGDPNFPVWMGVF